MGLETATNLDELNPLFPLATDPRSEGDDHLRMLKTCLRNVFPGLAGRFGRVQTKSAGYTLTATDNQTLLNCTAGLTLAGQAAATAGNGFGFWIYANGGAVVFDPAGAELVNGAATATVANGNMALVVCTGTAWVLLNFAGSSLTASEIANVPAGGLVAVDMQAAVNELDTEKAALAGSASQAFSASTLTVATDAIVPSLNGGQLAGFRNRIINGDMRISQRGVAPIASGIGVDTYITDRFIVNAAGASLDCRQNSDAAGTPSGFTSNLKISGAASNTNCIIKHRIESLNAASLASNTVTVSFYLFQDTGATLTGVTVKAYCPTTTADTFSAVTQEGSTQTLASVPSGGVARYSVQIAIGASNVVRGLEIQISLNAALLSGKTVYMTGLQLEVGTIATPFEQRPVGTELALCQRYFNKTYNTDVAPGTSTQVGKQSYSVQAAANTYFRWDARFPVSMRAAPTFTVYSTTGASGNVRLNNASDLAVTTEDAGMSGASLYLLRNAALGDFFWFHWTASAEL